MEKIILVDDRDNVLGEAEKMEAHKKGLLHRAFSVFIFNSGGKLMLQKRAGEKYHSGGLWTNTCCSHPTPDEDIISAAHRRLKEEMGFDCKLEKIYSFVYKAKLDNNLTEYECDHVIFGKYDGDASPDKSEAEEWKWVDKDWLLEDMQNNPEKYTYWLKSCYRDVLEKMKGC